MGYARPRPERLAEKLRAIRLALGLSLAGIHKRLGAEDKIASSQISEYETGRREPPLLILLRYARLAGVHTEVLIDDELDLPAKLPGSADHEAIRRAHTSGRKKRKS